MLRRRKIRRSLTEFARLCGFEPAAHHKLIIDALEAVSRGDTRRLAIFMPPGSAKSTYASVLFPTWVLSQHSNWNILAASHSVELAEKWGRRVRNLVKEYEAVLDIGLSDDSTSAGRWSLKSKAEFYAAGVGTGIAGFRGSLGLIDDPIRSRQDADSAVVRDRIWEWYLNDFGPRMVPGSSRVLIQTRWHEDDLAGRALEHEKWDVLSLPAEADSDNDPLGRAPGTMLWEDGTYGYGAQLREVKATTPARTWSALYQQKPVPDTGDYFKSEWLRYYDETPALSTMKVYMGADYAVTSDGGDYTAIVTVGIDPANRMWLLDVTRMQASSDVWVSTLADLILKFKPQELAEETGQIRAGVGPFMTRELMARNAYVYRRLFPTRGDKSVRAQSIRGRMAMHGLYVPQHAPWTAEFVRELLSFPAAKHDDQVDALGLVGMTLDHAHAGSMPVTIKKPPTELIFRVQPNGALVSNMSVMERVMQKQRAKERDL